MPITQAELKERIASDLLKKYFKDLTVGQVQDTLTGMGAQQRQRLVALLSSQQTLQVGEFLVRQVAAHLKGLATTEADTIVSDNTLSAAEINRWLGDG